MYQQHPVTSSQESKKQAASRLSNLNSKQRKVRHKRELVDLPFSSSAISGEEFKSLLTHVGGTTGWAKIVPGSVKIVKRYSPPKTGEHGREAIQKF